MSPLSYDSEMKQEHEWTEEAEVSQDKRIQAYANAYVPGSDEEKAFVRKIDKRIVVSSTWTQTLHAQVKRENMH